MAGSMLMEDLELARSRDEEKLTPLHVLARKPMDKLSPDVLKQGRCLIDLLWSVTRQMDYDDMLMFINSPSLVSFDAAKSGNVVMLKILLQFDPDLLTIIDSKRRTLFHIAVLHRQPSVLSHLMSKEEDIFKEFVIQAVDDDGNNILHMAGMASPDQRFASSRLDNLMQAQLLWFKEVEKRVPTGYKYLRNKEGQTPKDVFYSTHKNIMISANLAMKNKANYGMLVATIVATIVFAASFIVPGHDIGHDLSAPHHSTSAPGGDISSNVGPLILQKQGWFIVFFLSNSLALLSSSISIISFLAVLASNFAEDEFNSSLLLRLTSGVTMLFLAITMMLVAFTAACFLIFICHSIWVAYLVASLSCLTVVLLVFLFYNLLRHLISFLYWFTAKRAHKPIELNLGQNMKDITNWRKTLKRSWPMPI